MAASSEMRSSAWTSWSSGKVICESGTRTHLRILTSTLLPDEEDALPSRDVPLGSTHSCLHLLHLPEIHSDGEEIRACQYGKKTKQKRKKGRIWTYTMGSVASRRTSCSRLGTNLPPNLDILHNCVSVVRRSVDRGKEEEQDGVKC